MFRNRFTRAGLMLSAAVLLMAAGCRSTTDRIRVLEAEKADAERRNQDLQNQQAEARAKLIEAESRAESEEARRRAAEAQLELIKRQPQEPAGSENSPSVDIDRLRDRLRGEGITVRDDGAAGATIILASDITFRAGRADLNTSAEASLQRVVRALREIDGIRELRIGGHTDSDPIRKSGWADNRELSLARAETVRTYLVSQGLDETAMNVEGHGATQPVEPNSTNDGKAKNRRVEIILVTR